MMPLKRWRIAAIVGLTVPLVSLAAAGFQQQSGSQKGSNTTVPAKAVTDPDAPPPPDDPQAQPPKKDDDLAPEPESSGQTDTPAETGAKGAADQGKTSSDSAVHATPAAAKPDISTAPVKGSDSGTASSPKPVTTSTDEVEQVQARTKYGREAAELLNLVQQLKVEVDKAGSNTLSLAALRKADEIQRLAKDLKEKMRDQGQMVPGKP
jgi:hypothetical protein